MSGKLREEFYVESLLFRNGRSHPPPFIEISIPLGHDVDREDRNKDTDQPSPEAVTKTLKDTKTKDKTNPC